MQNQRTPVGERPKISSVEVYWKTVTYRTVAVYILLVFAIVMATLYLIYPEVYSGTIARVSHALGSGANANADLTPEGYK
jgi:hypothetical protein